MASGILAATMARLAALDGVCDFRIDRRERTQIENAGRAFRFWRVEIALRGELDRPLPHRVPLTFERVPPHITVEGTRLAETLERAVDLAEAVNWTEARAQTKRAPA